MGKVIVISSGKGGVGKTTTTANIGAGLASKGFKVVLMDTDIGLRNLDVVMGLENRIVFDLVDVVEGQCKLKQALIKDKRYDGLYLLPAAQTKDKTAVTPEQMKELKEELKKEFDYVLVDCPAGIEQGFRNAVIGAEKAIVVTVPEVSAVRDADRIIGMIAASEISDIKLVINKIRYDMVKSGDMLSIDDTLDILGVKLLGIVPEDENIIKSSNMGEPVVKNPNAPAGKAYDNIVRRILGEDVPVVFEEEAKGLFGAFKKLFSK